MRSKVPLPLLAVCLTLALQVAAPVGVALAAEGSSTEAVNALHASLNAHDVDGSLSVFAEDAVVIQPRMGGLPQIYVGRDQIRWWLRNLASQHAQFDWSASPEANATHVRWSEFMSVAAFRQLGLASLEVESDVVLNDKGVIDSMTTVLTPRSARAIQDAPGAAVTDVAERPGAEAVVGWMGMLSAGFAGGAATALFITRRRQRALDALGLPAPSTG